ncbi:MAG TPA: PrsW family glutamic-type intramembrane protease [Clostridia bacterium]|nr:PrsW family glutamic-type intramembrane protease [Clostridia bacterium]
MLLLAAALAPSAALIYYFYTRDKYEKEPRLVLLKSFLMGGGLVIPVLFVEMILDIFNVSDNYILSAGYTAFIVAGLVEEAFKFLFFFLYIWKNREFNEMYDGIVYSVFISMGFATVENLAYVLSTGMSTAAVRAVTAVPAHALFAVAMGYYLGIAKFAGPRYRQKYLRRGFIIPVMLHGIYDFILLSHKFYLLVLFVPYMLYLWKRGLSNVEELVGFSPFRDGEGEEE